MCVKLHQEILEMILLVVTQKIVPLLYNSVAKNAAPDEKDVLDQVSAVSYALKQMGYTVIEQPFEFYSGDSLQSIVEMKPRFLFNLVEAVSGEARLSYLAPALFEAHGFEYTGCSAESLLLTTNKIATKEMMLAAGIPTPPWAMGSNGQLCVRPKNYIIKPTFEDGSIGLGHDSVVEQKSTEDISYIVTQRQQETGKAYFAEQYIAGREFNVSILGNRGKPEVLPPSEIKFTGYKARNMPEILDYRAKWDEESFEYRNTVPSFDYAKSDAQLLCEIKAIAKACWHQFGLKGYARVDFRVDERGRPWVLEVNANPCLSASNSGFVLAAAQAGIDFQSVVKRIVAEATVQ
ncbi:MAG: D-alanine-D-alanine ligase [Bacillota bacterium]|nr:MAG: D-alanine-D-alanine ligase [Bacillota bacterium]